MMHDNLDKKRLEKSNAKFIPSQIKEQTAAQYSIKNAIELTRSLGVILQSPEEAMQDFDSASEPRKYHLTRGIAIYVMDKDTPTVYFYNEPNSPIINHASFACSKSRWILPVRDSSIEIAIRYAMHNNDAFSYPPEKIKLGLHEENQASSEIITSILGKSTKKYETYLKSKGQPRLVNLLAREAYTHIGKENADIRCIGLDTMNNILIINAKAEPINSYGIIQDITNYSSRR